MIKCINGWTKAKILAVIEARPFEEQAYDEDMERCLYLTNKGNKCAVGLFIPDGHMAQHSGMGADALIDSYPDLRQLMPLHSFDMGELQFIHDKIGNRYRAKTAMIEWVKENVED